MKIALYIEDGLEQIVLTPTTDVEKSLLAKLDNRSLTIRRGGFIPAKAGGCVTVPNTTTTAQCLFCVTIWILTHDRRPHILGSPRLPVPVVRGVRGGDYLGDETCQIASRLTATGMS